MTNHVWSSVGMGYWSPRTKWIGWKDLVQWTKTGFRSPITAAQYTYADHYFFDCIVPETGETYL